jgi:hypothetical protein
MLHITDEHYRALAEKLLTAIHKADFYNGTIDICDQGFDVSFKATLIIKRSPARDPANPSENVAAITDIIPIWWEYHLYDVTGERFTDFDWYEMKNFLT